MIGKMEMDLNKIYDKKIYGIHISYDGNLVIYVGNGDDAESINEIYKLDISYMGKELTKFTKEIDAKICYDTPVVLESIKRYKNITEEHSYCLVFSFKDLGQKYLPIVTDKCDLYLIVANPCLKDFIGHTLTRIRHDNTILDIYLKYYGMRINIERSFIEAGAEEVLTYGNINEVIGNQLLDVTATYSKRDDLLTDENKKYISDYYETDNISDCNYIHLDICFKSTKYNFGIIWFIIDCADDKMHLNIGRTD